MENYSIKEMVIDNEDYGEEHVTVYFVYNKREYSATFNKADFELVNAWVFDGSTAIPADLPEHIIHTMQEELESQ